MHDVRRANLSGKQRADGRWEIRITLTRLDGAKVRKSIFGKTLAECQAKAHALIFESGRVQQEGITLAELANIWRASWKLRPSTQRSYEYALSLILPKLGHKPCHALKVAELMGVVLRADTDRKSRLMRTVLGTMLNYGVLVGACEANPMRGIRSPRGYAPRRRRLAEPEFEAMIQGIPDHLRPFFLFLADTGLRPWSEAIGLTRADIGYRADEFFVTVTKSKTAAGVRIVPIQDPRVKDFLMETSGPLWVSASTYKRAWTKVAEDTPIYALRALAISKWCETEDLDVVKARAGHTDLRLTLDIYNQVQNDRILTGEGVRKGVKLTDLWREEP